MLVESVNVRSILTRTGGFLKGVASHTLQPYRGCTFGRTLCGVGCYVRHSPWITQGRPWGSFLEARSNAADVYRQQFAREKKWAHRNGGSFSIFCSSATDPFLPQEKTLGITRLILKAMLDQPPDELILQTHTDQVSFAFDLIVDLAQRTRVRLHLSVETDREQIDDLPRPAATVSRRLAAAARFRGAGIPTVITVAPLLPIDDPPAFFTRIGEAADAVVIDHFIGGDGTPNGSRTRKTALPVIMERLEPSSVTIAYRDRIVRDACQIMPGRVGVGARGFAGVYDAGFEGEIASTV